MREKTYFTKKKDEIFLVLFIFLYRFYREDNELKLLKALCDLVGCGVLAARDMYVALNADVAGLRSEEHTSELQSR